MEDTPTGATPPPAPPPPPPHILTRSVSDRVLAGVCGGLAEYLGVEPLLVRIAFAVSIVVGIGIALYLVAWLLIPEAGAPRRTGLGGLTHAGRHSARTVIGAVLLVTALLVVVDGIHLGHDGIWWGAALVTVGVLLFMYERGAPAAAAFPAPPPAPGGYAASFSVPAAPAAAPAVRAPRERSALALVTVAMALFAVGMAAIIANLAGGGLSLGAGFAIALLTVGVGLVAGAWFGRSRALIVLGVLLLPLAAGASLVREPLTGGAGDIHFAPQAAADIRSDYQLAAGQLSLDLSQVDFSTRSAAVTATVALGQLYVIVPPGVSVDIRSHVGAGEINLFGHVNDGVNVDATSGALAGAATTLHLDLSVGLGDVRVTDNAALAPSPTRVP